MQYLPVPSGPLGIAPSIMSTYPPVSMSIVPKGEGVILWRVQGRVIDENTLLRHEPFLIRKLDADALYSREDVRVAAVQERGRASPAARSPEPQYFLVRARYRRRDLRCVRREESRRSCGCSHR